MNYKKTAFRFRNAVFLLFIFSAGFGSGSVAVVAAAVIAALFLAIGLGCAFLGGGALHLCLDLYGLYALLVLDVAGMLVLGGLGLLFTLGSLGLGLLLGLFIALGLFGLFCAFLALACGLLRLGLSVPVIAPAAVFLFGLLSAVIGRCFVYETV